MPIPVLRRDIEIFAGPLEEDGSPTYVIHDPVTESFSKIGWGEAIVLRRMRGPQALEDLRQKIQRETTLPLPSAEEIAVFCQDAAAHGLTTNAQVKPVEELVKMAEAKKTSLLKWLGGRYLYVRFPLIRPDRFLTQALPWVRPLASRYARLSYLVLALLGIYFLTQRFETYLATFPHFFSLRGFIAYAAVIAALKAAHEFGHAFVAKHYGVRVSVMGVALLVLAPVAYCDVTDAWRIRDRARRLQIALAGIKVELVIGGIALALWGLTPPGILNSTCFLLSSTTLVSTFLVNLNPAMRFDGYYILSDLWGIDNLSTRSTEFTKWWLRRRILGIDAPCPMHLQTRRRRAQILIYSLFSWTYRLFLYLSIAVFVYYKFTKSLGILLFTTEIVMFILKPIAKEIKELREMKSRIRPNLTMAIVLGLAALAFAWAALPLTRNKEAPAVFVPLIGYHVYAPQGGQVLEVKVQRGQEVKAGDLLVQLTSEAVNGDIEYLSISVNQRRHDIQMLAMDDERTAVVPELERQLAAVEAELAGKRAEQGQFAVRAKLTGVLTQWDEMISPGSYVQEHQDLGQITSMDHARVDAFLSEKDIKQIDLGQVVQFYPVGNSPPITGTIERVDPIRERTVEALRIGSVAASDLPLVEDPYSDKLVLLESYYRVTVRIDPVGARGPRLGEGGYLRYHTNRRSLVWDLMLYCYSVLIRESSF